MEKRKRFDDELLDLENPGADDSFLNEYLQDEESKKKLKKSSPVITTMEPAPVKTIKISFKKFSLPNESPAISLTTDPVSSNGASFNAPLAAPSLTTDPVSSKNSGKIQAQENEAHELSASSMSTAPSSVSSTVAPLPPASSNKQAKHALVKGVEIKSTALPSGSSSVAPLKEMPKQGKHALVKGVETISKIKQNRQNIQQPAGQALDIKIETMKNVVNDKRLDYIPKETRLLGHVLYTGALQHSPGSWENLELFLLPKFSVLEHYALIEVRIPFEFLEIKENLAVQANAVWGTLVYTDDSDVIAALIHSGNYKKDQEKNDLTVTLRILPRLEKYQGSSRNGISSRSWGSFHDGESFKIEKVETLALGSAKKFGRKKGSKDWANQSSSLKKEARLVMTSEDGWLKYSLPSSKTLSWSEKLKTHDLIFELDSKRFELSFRDSKFLLKDNNNKSSTKTYNSFGFTDSGILLDERKMTLERYVWRPVGK